MVLNRAYRSQENLVRYWALEAVKLCNAIGDMSVAAMEEPVADVHAALRLMSRERRVVVVGAAGCGKSSLLAGLAGCPLMAQLPLPSPCLRWRYRNEDGDASLSRFLAEPELEGLELVDTRPCTEAAVQEALAGLLPGADVLIAVIDGRTPESSPVWELLASEAAASARTAMLAVTFASGPQTSDALRECCRERLGRSLPVYCVNPASAAAMDVFRERVQDALDSPAALRADIRAVMDAGDRLLRKLGSALMTLEAKFRTNSGFIRRIDEEIDYFLAHQRSKLPQHMGFYTEASRRALPRLMRRMRRALGWFFSPVTILRLELLGSGAERFYYRGLRDDLLQLQQDSDEHFIFTCAGHWKDVRPRMLQELACDIGEFPEEELAGELAQLRERLGRELYAPFAHEQLRHHLGSLCNARAGWMRTSLAFICLFLFVAGALGVLAQDVPALALVAVAALIWLGATVGHLVAARRICRGIGERCARLEAPLGSTLAASVEQLVISRVTAYRRLYTMPRCKVAALEEELQPRQKEHQNILRQLRAVAPHL